MQQRAQKLVASVMASMVALGGAMVTSPTPAAAAGEVLAVRLSQVDGTPSFDASDGPGLDASPNNGIVRTNDNLTYQVEVSVNDAVPGSGSTASNVVFEMDLPQGVELDAPPPFCRTDSAATPPSSLTPATLPPPAVPTTLTSWTTLPTQTLRCNIGDRSPNSTFTYPVVVKARSEVPNGTVLAPTSARATSDAVTVPVASDPVQTTISARAQFDISKNSISETANAGYFSSSGLVNCSDGSGRRCQQYVFPMLISAPAGGKGTTPLQSPVTFSDDVDVASIYGSAVLSDPDWLAAGAGATAKYGPILNGCRGLNWSQPESSLSRGSVDEAVRDSGTTTCTQPGGPGTPIGVSIANMDSTAYTVPSRAARPDGLALPANRGYVYSYALTLQIPLEAVIDLGTQNGAGTTWTLNWNNRYTDFAPLGIDGVSNLPSAQETFNDNRSSSVVASTSGSFDKYFVGVPGTPGNVSPTDFNPGWAIFEGPAGGTGPQTGEGQLFPGQSIVSMLNFDARNGTTGIPVSYLACDGWDPTLLQLQADNYPGSATARAQSLPSNGAPVWISGRAFNGAYATEANSVPLPTATIEYGTGPAGAGMTCNDADSPDGWFADPAAVPGNDPAAMAQGRYTAVTKVRVHLVQQPHTTSTGAWTWVSIGLRSTPGLAVDTVIPNFASVKIEHGDFTMAQMLASARAWAVSSYVPATNVGSRGDRVRAGGVVVRLAKEVRQPATSGWVTSTPAVTGGQQVDFRLRPTLTAGVSFPVSLPVRIEDCLPEGQTYLSSTVTPSIVQSGAPADGELPCATGRTYLRWDLGDQPVNTVIDPIEYTVRISPVATAGTKRNDALVSSPSDTSSVGQRSASAQVQVTQPAGIAIDKIPLTPVVEVNRIGETAPDRLEWEITMVNLETSPGPTDPDLIDVLPADGLHASAFDGSLEFVSATVTAGGPATRILYTEAPAADISLDALDPTNDPSIGSTVWCDRPSGGVVVFGNGTAADCPSVTTDVTGLRVIRPGSFGPGSQVKVILTMLPSANSAGDVYDNIVAARGVGLALPVGPVNAQVRVIDSSIGDRVWDDRNGNGVQDPGEPGISGLNVRLNGTDSDANSVTATTTTGSDGAYRFDGLASGDYEITFSLPAPVGGVDPVFTFPSMGTSTSLDSDGDTAGLASVTLLPNSDRSDLDQGVLFPRPGIEIVKSINGDDANTAPGVAVDLGSTMLVTFDVTNIGNLGLRDVTVADSMIADGDILCPTATLTVGASMTCTAQLPAPAARVQHRNTATVTATPMALPDATVLDDISDADDAYATSVWAELSGYVFDDVDNDGTFDAAGPFGVVETGIANVTVTLHRTDVTGFVPIETTTDSAGRWRFADLEPGTYRVVETQPTDYLDGLDAVGSHGGALGDDEISSVVLIAGDRATGYDFGERSPALVSGSVVDEHGQPIAGVEVTLTGSAEGVPIAPVPITTGVDGTWSFGDLLPGFYTVTETQPVLYGDGDEVPGTNGATSPGDDRFDVALIAGQASTGNTFVETYGSISGTVFHDLDDDGVQMPSESGIGGVSVTLDWFDADGVAQTRTIATGPDGRYVFVDLLAASYTVSEEQPADYDDGIDTAGDLGGDTTANDVVWGIVLPPGHDAVGYDFAEVGTVLSGTVWIDRNGDGVISSDDEPGRLGGVVIRLFDAADTDSGAELATTTTDADGNYLFPDLVAGDYRVVQDQPVGWGSTTPNELDVSVPLSGLNDVDFGEGPGSIAGTVWDDHDGDGIADAEEPIRSDVLVELLDASAVTVASMTTDTEGNYRFDDLPAGEYSVRVVPPTTARLTAPDRGVDRSVDSDVDWLTGETATITLAFTTCPDSNGTCRPMLPAIVDIDAGLVAGEIDLSIVKDLFATSIVEPGSTVEFGLTVANNSAGPVPGAVVADVMPDGLELVSVTAPGWLCTHDAAQLRCRTPNALEPSEVTRTIRLTASVADDAPATIVNTASVQLSDPAGDPLSLQESDLENNTDTASVSVVRERATAAGTSSTPLQPTDRTLPPTTPTRTVPSTTNSTPSILAFTGNRHEPIYFGLTLLLIGVGMQTVSRRPRWHR